MTSCGFYSLNFQKATVEPMSKTLNPCVLWSKIRLDKITYYSLLIKVSPKWINENHLKKAFHNDVRLARDFSVYLEWNYGNRCIAWAAAPFTLVGACLSFICQKIEMRNGIRQVMVIASSNELRICFFIIVESCSRWVVALVFYKTGLNSGG